MRKLGPMDIEVSISAEQRLQRLRAFVSVPQKDLTTKEGMRRQIIAWDVMVALEYIKQLETENRELRERIVNGQTTQTQETAL